MRFPRARLCRVQHQVKEATSAGSLSRFRYCKCNRDTSLGTVDLSMCGQINHTIKERLSFLLTPKPPSTSSSSRDLTVPFKNIPRHFLSSDHSTKTLLMTSRGNTFISGHPKPVLTLFPLFLLANGPASPLALTNICAIKVNKVNKSK